VTNLKKIHSYAKYIQYLIVI